MQKENMQWAHKLILGPWKGGLAHLSQGRQSASSTVPVVEMKVPLQQYTEQAREGAT